VQPILSPAFKESTKWQTLSVPAKCALEGMLQFVTRKHCDWVIEGTPKQIGDWIGPEVNLNATEIVTALRELDTAGCIRRGRVGNGSSFIVAPVVVDR
jgi:hypothetical protein